MPRDGDYSGCFFFTEERLFDEKTLLSEMVVFPKEDQLFWLQKPSKIVFSSFYTKNGKGRRKRVLGAKVRNLTKISGFWRRKRRFRPRRANLTVANAFLGVLEPIFTIFALFLSVSHFLLKNDFEPKSGFGRKKRILAFLDAFSGHFCTLPQTLL